MRIALTGNPNSGKTTMFNALTGRSEKVGNWAGVTVEKKEHHIKRAFYKGEEELIAVDLPGAYSMSPFTSEESVTSSYVKNEHPDVIINIVDSTNLSRSLFFTTQLLELGIPVVVALNKADVNEKKENTIDTALLSEKLGCPVIDTVSTSHKGLSEVVKTAVAAFGTTQIPPYVQGDIDLTDKAVVEAADRRRFDFVNGIVSAVEVRKTVTKKINKQDKVDAVLTNKWLGIPIFALVMSVVFYLSQASLGVWLAEGYEFSNGFAIPGLVTFIEMFGGLVDGWLANAHPIWSAILVDGIIGGVGAVVGFLPLVMVMYFLISLLEDCGYMARVAVLLDPIFKVVGLSGKSIIPFIIGTGCAIPGVMACRTIRNERERRSTAILAPFMPCGAKLPVISLFAGAFFGNSVWVTILMYFSGIAIIFLGALLINLLTGYKARKSFFIMELPEYKAPSVGGAALTMCQRAWAYIVKAGTVILVCNFVVQLLLTFSWTFQQCDYDGITEEHTAIITEKYADYFNTASGADTNDPYADWATLEDSSDKYKEVTVDGTVIRYVVSENDEGAYEPQYYEVTTEKDGKKSTESYDMYNCPALDAYWAALSTALSEEADKSMLSDIALPFAYLFAPVVGNANSWELAASAVTGFIAKENVVGTLAVCFGVPNQINADFELIGDGAALQSAFGISAVTALAYLMFNLFTPPCFAAMGAMNAEIKSKKWLFAGIGFQFGMGYSIGFLVNFFGSLFTGTLLDVYAGGIWSIFLGWGIVLGFAGLLTFLIIRTQMKLKEEYTLGATATAEPVATVSKE